VGKRKPGPGRTPKLDPAASRAICDAVAAGVPQKYAALRAGVSDRTVQLWVARGKREKSGPYVSFLSALKKAQADRLAASVGRIGRAAAGGQVVERTTTTVTKADGSATTKTTEKLLAPQWTADAWFLERTHPDEFAANRREVKELRDQLAALLKAVAGGKLQAVDPAGAPAPRVGGDADPRSV
jgi:transposase